MSDKEVVIETLRQMPEGATLEQISEEIAIMAAIRKGEEAADAGRVTRHEEVRQKLAAWISKYFGPIRRWLTCTRLSPTSRGMIPRRHNASATTSSTMSRRCELFPSSDPCSHEAHGVVNTGKSSVGTTAYSTGSPNQVGLSRYSRSGTGHAAHPGWHDVRQGAEDNFVLNRAGNGGCSM